MFRYYTYMNIAILGFDLEGRSSYAYWSSPDNQITICDRNTELDIPDGADSQLGEGYLNDLGRFDLLIRTPGMHPRDITAANPGSPHIPSRVTTNTNEFLRVSPSRNIIGITGTKGKGTTSTLTARMLAAAGKTVHLGGNIGIPPLELLNKDIKSDDWVVLELSNFQLIDLKSSPTLAACLMVVPEHMDWHVDFDEYVAAKSQLFRWQSQQDTAVYYAGNATSKQVAATGDARTLPYMQTPGAVIQNDTVVIDGVEICKTDEIKLLGAHNHQNICAATTVVWQVVQDPQAIRSVATTFTGLEHRLELVRELDDVKYYNDSFGTTPETAIVAIKSFGQPKVVILGGSDKGSQYEELARTVTQGNVRQVLTIGDMAPRIESALQQEGYTAYSPGGENMKQIVDTARQFAQPGDIVLLSTGCASFGMFKNYKDRGEQFKQAVNEL